MAKRRPLTPQGRCPGGVCRWKAPPRVTELMCRQRCEHPRSTWRWIPLGDLSRHGPGATGATTPLVRVRPAGSSRAGACLTRHSHVTVFSARSYRRDTLPPDIMPQTGLPVHKQAYGDEFDSDYEYYTTVEDQDRQPIKPVPIWLCVFLVVSYIFGGAFLFSAWENWPFLDSAYFCFITLTTIGERNQFLPCTWIVL